VSEPSPLHPATPDEVADSLAYALRFRRGRRVSHGDELMARIVAEFLVAHLQQSGYVLMRRPPLDAPSASGHGRAP
jgi:hypothetical protein